MTSFVALYRGPTVGGAELVAVSAAPELVRELAAHMLTEPGGPEADAALHELECGRRRALRLIRDQASE